MTGRRPLAAAGAMSERHEGNPDIPGNECRSRVRIDGTHKGCAEAHDVNTPGGSYPTADNTARECRPKTLVRK